MSLDALLADLKKEYVAGLPARLGEMRTHFAAQDFDQLQDAFHRLKGTGRTYGLPDISTVAECGEVICRDHRENISKAIPLLLDLLAAIHQSATIHVSFDLSRDPRFSDLQKLV
ncbi:MAG: Hpt domain-containing protein [Patescibacteria group bacterium]|nr:Hpt domain-containing protein [Patescibacteria group bacterium]